MLIIGLDTTSQSGSVSLINENKILGECLFNVGPRHSENVVSSLEWLLDTLNIEKREIEALAVSIGPGSFTSIRVGVTIAKSLAYSMKIKIVGVSSLEVLAMNIPQAGMNICSMLDAKRNEVYSAIYKYNNDFLTRTRDEKVGSVEALLNDIKVPTVFVGDGSVIYKKELANSRNSILVSDNFNIIRSSNCALLGIVKLNDGNSDDVMGLVPNYLRKTDVE
jgi:tRNA threonylcarbamoyladenosine biosynthesis protein TsaB